VRRDEPHPDRSGASSRGSRRLEDGRVRQKESRREIAEIKAAAANMDCEVVDRAIQAFGGEGVTRDHGLDYMYKYARTLRVVDGADEVHRHQLGRRELAKYAPARAHV
jgi:acyl-CoA dehydrogenase